jgi:hypothetical protein
MSLNRGSSLLYIFGLFALVLPFQNCAPAGKAVFNSLGSSSLQATSIPLPPSMLNAQAVSAAEIDLTWSDNSNNEANFRIERAVASSGPFVSGGIGDYFLIGTVGAGVTAYADKTVSAGTTYYYRVSASNSKGVSNPTAPANLTTPTAPNTAPAAPSNLVATVNSATIVTLNWQDNSSNEYGFKVERATGAGSTAFTQIATVSANQTSYEVTNLNPSTFYTFRIRSTNPVGDSATVTSAGVTTQAAVNMATYSYLAANVFGPNCVTCHSAAAPTAGINMSNYTAVFANRTVAFSSVAANRMPPGSPLSSTQIAAFKAWIDSGAPNN